MAMKIFYSLFLLSFLIWRGDANADTVDVNNMTCFELPVSDTLDTAMSNVESSLLKDPANNGLTDKEILKKNSCINGIASFYSKNLEGTKTSTGETFHHNNYTAASNNFPLNTWVKVTNAHNGKSVIVRINDRMHPRMAKKGRVVDLTITAAKKIGLTNTIGITKVTVEQVDPQNLD